MNDDGYCWSMVIYAYDGLYLMMMTKICIIIIVIKSAIMMMMFLIMMITMATAMWLKPCWLKTMISGSA